MLAFQRKIMYFEEQIDQYAAANQEFRIKWRVLGNKILFLIFDCT